ncbi:hypothetical protein [Carboxylicivirga sp. RSCT41]|uniref:hypothetical protein n=1 Tax=Carboxylicivirga agarovorans TaxID=3417570 RepID=UPI003D3387C6
MSNKSEFRQVIKDLTQDLLTNEVAICDTSSEDKRKITIVSYSRQELEGDAVSVINHDSQAIAQLHSSLVKSSIKNRSSIWRLISKALR